MGRTQESGPGRAGNPRRPWGTLRRGLSLALSRPQTFWRRSRPPAAPSPPSAPPPPFGLSAGGSGLGSGEDPPPRPAGPAEGHFPCPGFGFLVCPLGPLTPIRVSWASNRRLDPRPALRHSLRLVSGTHPLRLVSRAEPAPRSGGPRVRSGAPSLSPSAVLRPRHGSPGPRVPSPAAAAASSAAAFGERDVGPSPGQRPGQPR